MAYLELVLFIGAIVGLIVIAQRSRLRSKDYAALEAVAARRGLSVERGVGTAELSGRIAERGVRVFAVMDGWVVSVDGVADADVEAVRSVIPEATVGAGRVQLPTRLDADAIEAALDQALAAVGVTG